MKRQILIVDGYNMIGSWPGLKDLKNHNEIEDARDLLLSKLSNYSAYHGIETWVVFDAQFVPGLSKNYDQYNLHVVYTSEGQTADEYIESMIKEVTGVLRNVTVATSDLAEQRMVFQQGAVRKSARELYQDVIQTENTIRTGGEQMKQSSYSPNIPWSYYQLQELKNLLHRLSDNPDSESDSDD